MNSDHPGERRGRRQAPESDLEVDPVPATPQRDDIPDADEGEVEPEPQGDEDGWLPV